MARTYITLNKPEIPQEQKGNLFFGLFGHFGPPLFFVGGLLITGITVWNTIFVFLAVSFSFVLITLFAERRFPSLGLPTLTLKDIWEGLVMVFFKAVIVGGLFVFSGWWLLSHVSLHAEPNFNWGLIILATLGTDFSYYWIHRMMCHGRSNHPVFKYYKRKHAPHHAVEELDFMRGNHGALVETAFSQFQISLIVISWLLGMDLASTFIAYGLVMSLQASDHSNTTYNIGWLRFIFMDNHAHKLHHCKRGNLINMAACFSIWDQIWGTFYEDWDLSSNYMHHHRIALPIKRKETREINTLQRVNS